MPTRRTFFRSAFRCGLGAAAAGGCLASGPRWLLARDRAPTRRNRAPKCSRPKRSKPSKKASIFSPPGNTTTARSAPAAMAATWPFVGWPAWRSSARAARPAAARMAEQVDRCVDFILSHTRGKRLHQRYFGVEPRPDVRPRLRHDVSRRVLRHDAAGRYPRKAHPGRRADRQHAEHRRRLALSAGSRAGGRHLGDGLRSHGLCAARNAGLHVPKDTIDRSIAYVKKSQNEDGGFMYMLPAAGRARFRARRPPSSRCTAPASTKARKSKRGWTI